MKKTKLEKGITLIALIITIILLLILAVVTIGSIKDSKIIGYAQEAANEYSIGKEKEQSALALSEQEIEKYTGKTSAKGISISPTGITINERETQKITVTLLGGLAGEITYSSENPSIATVNSEGEVTGEGLGSTTITVTCGEYKATCQVGVSNIKEYLFGTSLSGRYVGEVLNTNNGQFLNTTEPKLLGSDTITSMEVTQIGDWGYAYFEYQGIYYKVRANMSTSELEGVQPGYSDANYGLKVIDIQGEKIGKTVKYDNKLWTIIYDDSTNGLQMLSNESLNWVDSYPFVLGGYDSLEIDWNNIKDLNENNSIDRFEEAIHSYNNAIKTLNIACDNIVADSKYIKEVRCVGTNPIDKDAENENLYTSENLEIWPTSSAGIINYEAKGTDENFISDYDRMLVLGKLQNGSSYWFGSRFIYEAEERLNFAMRRYDVTHLNDSEIFCVSQTEVKHIGNNHDLRPVVVLNSDANLVPDTTGTADYILQ